MRPDWRWVGLAAAGLALAGCTSGSSSSAGSEPGMGRKMANMIFYGSATPPPPAPPKPGEVEVECPSVAVGDGKAALRVGGASADSVRSQLSIADVARECTEQANGAISVKIGVLGRVLLGPGGSAARMDAPVYFIVRRGERVFVSRAKRVPVTVTPGDIQGSFTVVEDGFIVPPGTGEFEIEIGLGAPASGVAGKRRPG